MHGLTGLSGLTGLVPVGAVAESAPNAPSDSAGDAEAVPNAIVISWTDNSSNEDGFEVERSADGVSFWENRTTTAANATSYNDDVAGFGGFSFYYRVRAVNAFGNSAYDTVIGPFVAGGGVGPPPPP